MNRVHSRFVVFTICVTVSMSSSASVTTFANGESVTHKSSNGVSIAFPDVCKTPPVPIHGPIPIPYPNIAVSGDKSVPSKSKVSGKKPVAADRNSKISNSDDADTAGPKSSKVRDTPDFVRYSFDVMLGGQMHIRQSPDEATSSVTKVTYVDPLGKEIKVQEPTLIELTNGEFCGVCTANGKVTAIYRLLPTTPKRKKRQAPRQID